MSCPFDHQGMLWGSLVPFHTQTENSPGQPCDVSDPLQRSAGPGWAVELCSTLTVTKIPVAEGSQGAQLAQGLPADGS